MRHHYPIEQHTPQHITLIHRPIDRTIDRSIDPTTDKPNDDSQSTTDNDNDHVCTVRITYVPFTMVEALLVPLFRLLALCFADCSCLHKHHVGPFVQTVSGRIDDGPHRYRHGWNEPSTPCHSRFVLLEPWKRWDGEGDVFTLGESASIGQCH